MNLEILFCLKRFTTVLTNMICNCVVSAEMAAEESFTGEQFWAFRTRVTMTVCCHVAFQRLSVYKSSFAKLTRSSSVVNNASNNWCILKYKTENVSSELMSFQKKIFLFHLINTCVSVEASANNWYIFFFWIYGILLILCI